MTRTEPSDLEIIEESPLLLASGAFQIAPSRETDVMLDLPENILRPASGMTDHPGITDPAASELPANNNSDGTAELRSAAQKIWKMCVETIRPQISSQTMRTWFEPLVATQLEGSEITLRAPSNFFCEWITEHYQRILENSLKDVLGSTARFRFDSESDIESLNTKLEAPSDPQPPIVAKTAIPSEHEPRAANSGSPLYQTSPQQGQSFVQQGQNYPQGFAPAIPSQRTAFTSQGASQSMDDRRNAGRRQAVDPNLNPRYTFDTFIRGESNKLAYAAAMAVANNPGGTRYNPLVIYGNVGLGKTHLIQAVGSTVVQKFPGARVLYTSSDRFTVEFVDAIQNDRINEFQSLYRSIDVLIIDDVQFFAGKEKTQDIFFHTFNALRELGKQIILTCDRPPKELKDIDDRLLNRLQWDLPPI